MLPGLVGQTFLDRYMKNYKQVQGRIIGVMNNVRDAFADLIQKTSWLDRDTRIIAVDKVKSIVARAIVPNHWELEPFEDRITADCYLRNLNIIRRYRASRNFELWTRDQPDRDHVQRFSAPLTEVNAFYSGITNTITYFSGLAQEPFYAESYSDAAVYASVGAICGHELAHAMDPNGRMFDKHGNIRETWKNSDVAEFKKRIQCVIADYGAPYGCENAKYGEQTVGEDIADGTGLRAAYNAFNAVKKRTDAEKREFFETFALIWAESYDQKETCAAVASDEHAIGLYRVDKTLRSNEDFQMLYGCTKTDPMVNKDHCLLYGEEWLEPPTTVRVVPLQPPPRLPQ
jgi:predicted metalloendopeptidase